MTVVVVMMSFVERTWRSDSATFGGLLEQLCGSVFSVASFSFVFCCGCCVLTIVACKSSSLGLVSYEYPILLRGLWGLRAFVVFSSVVSCESLSPFNSVFIAMLVRLELINPVDKVRDEVK
jgi:hypothetical protein